MLDKSYKAEFLKTDLKFVLVNQDIELSSVGDLDLMRIKCFASHEGINTNFVEFNRSVLKQSYKTFIDKPLFIVLDNNGNPQGHGFNYKTKKFSDKNRKNIGHIVNAYPCIVDSTGKITEVEYMDEQNYPEGEYRIICEVVVYKKYESEISDIIAKLHMINNLNFSMESVCDYIVSDDGVKHCTSIHFTGLAIVKTPAFENSFSLELAEKEENDMEYEKLYNDTIEKVDLLIAEKTVLETDKNTLIAEKEELETQVLTVKEELAEANGKLVEVNAQIETLTPYKEQVENAEKLLVGKERLDKLSKYGIVTQTAEELAEFSKEDFIGELEKAVENYKPVLAENNGILGLPNTSTNIVSKKDRLMTILSEIAKSK